MGRYNRYKKTFQWVKKEVYGISKIDIQWLLEYYQVCILNRQNITKTLFQPIVVKEVIA